MKEERKMVCFNALVVNLERNMSDGGFEVVGETSERDYELSLNSVEQNKEPTEMGIQEIEGVIEVREGHEITGLKALKDFEDGAVESMFHEVTETVSRTEDYSETVLDSVKEREERFEHGIEVRRGHQVPVLKDLSLDDGPEVKLHEVANKVVRKRKDDADLLLNSVAVGLENGIEVSVDQKSSEAEPSSLPFPQNHLMPKKKKRTPRVEIEVLPGENNVMRLCDMHWYKQFVSPEFATDWLRRLTTSQNRTNESKRPRLDSKMEKVVKFVQKQNVQVINNDDEPEVPSALRVKIEEQRGRSPVLVIMKRLSATDLSPHHGRFSIPSMQIRRNFLTPSNIEALEKKEIINVSFIEPCLDVNLSMRLTKWDMSRRDMYMLITGWKSVIKNEKNGLEENDMVQLWSFRCNEDKDLWFALVKI